jgi:hypothetical protein
LSQYSLRELTNKNGEQSASARKFQLRGAPALLYVCSEIILKLAAVLPDVAKPPANPQHGIDASQKRVRLKRLRPPTSLDNRLSCAFRLRR